MEIAYNGGRQQAWGWDGGIVEAYEEQCTFSVLGEVAPCGNPVDIYGVPDSMKCADDDANGVVYVMLFVSSRMGG